MMKDTIDKSDSDALVRKDSCSPWLVGTLHLFCKNNSYIRWKKMRIWIGKWIQNSEEMKCKWQTCESTNPTKSQEMYIATMIRHYSRLNTFENTVECDNKPLVETWRHRNSGHGWWEGKHQMATRCHLVELKVHKLQDQELPHLAWGFSSAALVPGW